MQYYIYILYSIKLDRYYIGSTADVSDRLKKHNRSRQGFTSTGKPWILLYTEECNSKTGALRREKQLKSWKNRERLELLIMRQPVGSEHPD